MLDLDLVGNLLSKLLSSSLVCAGVRAFLQLCTTFHWHSIFPSNWGLVATIQLTLLLRAHSLQKHNLREHCCCSLPQKQKGINPIYSTSTSMELCQASSAFPHFTKCDSHTEQIIAMSWLLHKCFPSSPSGFGLLVSKLGFYQLSPVSLWGILCLQSCWAPVRPVETEVVWYVSVLWVDF